MKRPLFVLALAVLCAPAAAAPVPMAHSPASASRGITVNASASARVAATSARIALALNTYDNKPSLDTAALQPLVDALVKAGVDPHSIQLPLAFSAGARSSAATITATIAAPNVDTMRSGIALVGATVASLHDVRLNSAQVFLRTSNCADALAATRSKALILARSKAESIAHDLHVNVGPVLGVQSLDGASNGDSCVAQYWVGPEGPQFPPTMDGTDRDYVSIPVMSTVTVTYGIK